MKSVELQMYAVKLIDLWEGNKKLSSEEVVVRFHLRLCWFQAIYLAGIAR